MVLTYFPPSCIRTANIFKQFKRTANICKNVILTQEIYRPGTAISHASDLCTAVGGDQNK